MAELNYNDEKGGVTPHGRRVSEADETGGDYFVQRGGSSDDEAGSQNNSGLKTTKDGKTVLIPQPSDDPEDPLNWSWLKKHTVFLALLPGCLLTDWVITYGSTMFEQQVPDFHMAPPDISNSMSPAIFLQAPGGLLAVPLAQRYGRLPVLFWSSFLTLIVTIGASQAQGYAGFTACRALQGFLAAAPQVIGLSMIHDMFYFHERARKVNVWAFSFLLGPYLGPFISSFLTEKLAWRSNFGVLCGFYGFSVLAIIICGDETLYDRGKAEHKKASSPLLERIYRLIGVAGLRDCDDRPTLLAVTKDLFGLLTRPYVLLVSFGFVTWITMWLIGMVSTFPQFTKPPPVAGGYGFSATTSALFYFAPMIGTVLGEIWGHFFNDFLQNRYIAKHKGQFKPEYRLWAVYPATIVAIGGLVTYGQVLERHESWVGLAFGWGLLAAGAIATIAVISAYLLDVLPHSAALAAAWLNAARTVGGFSVTYFQYKWVQRNGAGMAFGLQGLIIGGALVSIILVQRFGPAWRVKFPAPTTGRHY